MAKYTRFEQKALEMVVYNRGDFEVWDGDTLVDTKDNLNDAHKRAMLYMKKSFKNNATRTA